MSFNAKGVFPGLLMVTEYEGYPVAVMDTNTQEGVAFMVDTAGAEACTLTDLVGLCYGDTPWVGRVIRIGDRVIDELPIPALGAVLEHELEHIRRADAGYLGLSVPQIVAMEVACDNAGARKYGPEAMATGVFSCVTLAALYGGMTPMQGLDTVNKRQPGRFDALVSVPGKAVTVQRVIEKVAEIVTAAMTAPQ